MADAVNVTTVEDGERQLVVQLTNLSDGTGESKVTKIDVSALNSSALGKSCNEIRIEEIWALFMVLTGFSFFMMRTQMLWRLAWVQTGRTKTFLALAV